MSGLLFSQDEITYVEIEVFQYKPKKVIKKLIEETSNKECFQGLSKGQHLLVFHYNIEENKHFLHTTVAPIVIFNITPKSVIDNISGVYYKSGNIVLIDFSRGGTNMAKKFFKKCGDKIKIRIPISTLETPCYFDYEIKNRKFELLGKYESWNPFDE